MKVFTATQVRTQASVGVIVDGAVVIDDRSIAWVGSAAAIPREFADAPRVHVEGTIMPGLIDTHVHLGFDGGLEPVKRMMRENDSEQLVVMLRSARQLLSAGVTTARDLGARGYLDVVVRDAIERGDARGPRMLVAGAPLTPTGGHCWFMGGEVDGTYELRKGVRRHHQAGVDTIKIMATGGFMTAGSAPWFAQFTQDELEVAIADAHRLGKRVVAHAHGAVGIARAVAAGVDALEHCSFVGPGGSYDFDPVIADAIARNGVSVSFTMNMLAWHLIGADESGFIEHCRMILREMHARGVRIVVGTDAGIDNAPHHAYAAALEVLAGLGMSNDDVLAAATSAAAASMGLETETGSLIPGLAADLIGVPGDPALDLTVLRRPALVIARGVDFTPDSYPDLADLPAPAAGVSIGQDHDH